MIGGQLGLVENILHDTTTEETFILLRRFLDLAPLSTEPILASTQLVSLLQRLNCTSFLILRQNMFYFHLVYLAYVLHQHKMPNYTGLKSKLVFIRSNYIFTHFSYWHNINHSNLFFLIFSLMHKMNSPFFHVVDFLEWGEVEVVSSRWMAGEDACYWPPYKFPNYIKRAQLQHEKPGADLETYKVRSLYKISKSFRKCCYIFEVHSLFTNGNAVMSQ